MNFNNYRFSFVVGFLLMTPGCGHAESQGVQSGEWKITTTDNSLKKEGKVRVEHRCISGDRASSPTLLKMLNKDGYHSQSSVDAPFREGRINAKKDVDTPDRDIRNIPIVINGTYNSNSFHATATAMIFGVPMETKYEGQRLGDCTKTREVNE